MDFVIVLSFLDFFLVMMFLVTVAVVILKSNASHQLTLKEVAVLILILPLLYQLPKYE
jgi:hypothetical protein